MMLKLKSSFLLIILSVFFYSCEKEYSLEGTVIGGTSVFSFTGSPGACTNSVVTGTYKVDTALAATNAVTISVDVSTIGTYTISTTTINGISFSGAGSFVNTGVQTIVLTGTGKPLASGTFPFSLGTNGCTFPITVTSGGGSSSGTAAFTLSGAPGTCTSFTPAGTFAAGVPLGTSNTATVSVNVTALGTYTISTNTINGIVFTGTGTFTAIGTQSVILIGSGTPIAGGNFDFTPGSNGCKFPLNVNGSTSGSSVFTYDGAPGTCTSAAPTGTYTAGTALTALNAVTIAVTVTSIGTYSLTTPVVNGFSFSGSGNFTTIGAQTITLTGTGTPVTAGLSTFTPSNNGCSFPVTVGSGVLTDFLTCKINNVQSNFNVDLLGELITSDTFDITGFTTSAATSPSFQLEIRKSPVITPGTYNKYLSPSNTSIFCLSAHFDGIAALPWITGVTTPSTDFTVNVSSYTTTRIQGTFSGTLYDNLGTGANTKVITNGQFSVPY